MSSSSSNRNVDDNEDDSESTISEGERCLMSVTSIKNKIDIHQQLYRLQKRSHGDDEGEDSNDVAALEAAAQPCSILLMFPKEKVKDDIYACTMVLEKNIVNVLAHFKFYFTTQYDTVGIYEIQKMILEKNPMIIKYGYTVISLFLLNYKITGHIVPIDAYNPLWITPKVFQQHIDSYVARNILARAPRKRMVACYINAKYPNACAVCTQYLAILLIKSSFLYYYNKYYSPGEFGVPKRHQLFKSVIDILLGQNMGLSSIKLRHQMIHTIFYVMASRIDFVADINRVTKDVMSRFWFSDQYSILKRFRTEEIEKTIIYDPAYHIRQFISDRLIALGVWTEGADRSEVKLRKLGMFIAIHIAMCMTHGNDQYDISKIWYRDVHHDHFFAIFDHSCPTRPVYMVMPVISEAIYFNLPRPSKSNNKDSLLDEQ